MLLEREAPAEADGDRIRRERPGHDEELLPPRTPALDVEPGARPRRGNDLSATLQGAGGIGGWAITRISVSVTVAPANGGWPVSRK